MSLIKPLMIYFCLALAISFWQPNIVFGNDNSYLSFFGGINNETYLGTVDTANNLSFNPTYAEPLQTNSSGDTQTIWDQIKQGVTSVTQPFIDGLGNIINYIKFFFKFMFSPWALLTNSEFHGMPTIILMIVLLPLSFWLLIEFIFFIRGMYS